MFLTPPSAAAYFFSNYDVQKDDLLFCDLVTSLPLILVLFLWIPQVVRAFQENRAVAKEQRALRAAIQQPPEPENP